MADTEILAWISLQRQCGAKCKFVVNCKSNYYKIYCPLNAMNCLAQLMRLRNIIYISRMYSVTVLNKKDLIFLALTFWLTLYNLKWIWTDLKTTVQTGNKNSKTLLKTIFYTLFLHKSFSDETIQYIIL